VIRVLVAHNRYRSSAPSGENETVDAEVALLREGGHEVVTMLTESDDIRPGAAGALQAAPGPVYSPSGVRRFRRLLHEHRPDVVHLHNVYPLISPWVVRSAGRAGVPVVQTVHNYRHGCVNGLHLRDGRACTDCLGTRLGLPAVRHGCYRGSRAQTVPMSVGQVVHRSTWRGGVARYLALTPFMADLLTSTGVPRERITIRPTWVPDPGDPAPPGRTVLYVGRLDEAKGIDRLLDAWTAAGGRDALAGRRLVVAGDGPMADRVSAAAAADPSVRWLGQVSRDEVGRAITEAAYLVVPSRVFEGYPLVVAEAFARGRPVLTCTGGSVGTIVTDTTGWVVDQGVDAIARALTEITDEHVAARSQSARTQYLTESSPEQALRSLTETYRQVTGR
jgi:glycosyltransferase involved in cell wall biosynthesis